LTAGLIWPRPLPPPARLTCSGCRAGGACRETSVGDGWTLVFLHGCGLPLSTRSSRGAAVGVRAGHRCDGACRGGLAPLVLGMRWQLRTRAVAALPGLATLVVAYVGTVDDASTRGDDFLVPSVLLAIEGSAVVAFLAIEAWQREVFRSRCPAPGRSAVGNHGFRFHPRGRRYLHHDHLQGRQRGHPSRHRVPHRRHHQRRPDRDHDSPPSKSGATKSRIRTTIQSRSPLPELPQYSVPRWMDPKISGLFPERF